MAICYFFVINRPAATLEPIEKKEEKAARVHLTGATKLKLLIQLLPYMTPLFVVYFGEYLINQGISSGNSRNSIEKLIN